MHDKFNIALVVLGGLLMIYSTVNCVILSVNKSNLLPGIIGIIIVTFALFLNWLDVNADSESLRKLSLILKSAVIVVALSFVALCSIIYINAKNVPMKDADVLIVLGSGLKGRTVTITLALRLNKAIEYYKENPDTTLVVSGGQGPNELVTEASAMQKYLIKRGVPSSKIIVEDESNSTEENFKNSKILLDKQFSNKPGNEYSMVYVTSDFHLLRSGFYAKKAGFQNAEGLACRSQFLMLPNYYCREYLAVLWYFAYEMHVES